eukprot:7314908-Pyramimonas_sp.AAC.1
MLLLIHKERLGGGVGGAEVGLVGPGVAIEVIVHAAALVERTVRRNLPFGPSLALARALDLFI